MTTQVLTEGQHKGEFLVSRGPGSISFEQAVLTHGQTVTDGRLMAEVGGKLVAATGAVDSSGGSEEVIKGFAYGNYDATDADVPMVIVARIAEVKAANVTLHAVAGAGAAAATAALKAEIAKNFLVLR